MLAVVWGSMNFTCRKPMQFVAIAAMLLIAATGFCLFDSHGGDHGSLGTDLCSGMIATAVTVLIVTAPLVASAVAVTPPVVAAVPSYILEPPPKFVLPS